MAFSDGWEILRVIWSESDTVRVRSSPLAHKKTWERSATMERSWWRTFASNWPPPPQLGPPVRRGWLPQVTPCSISKISEWWIGALSLSHLPLACTALYLWPKKQGRGCFCCLSSTNHQTAHSWHPEPWPGTKTLRRLPPICFLQNNTSSVVVAIHVMQDYFSGDNTNVWSFSTFYFQQ